LLPFDLDQKKKIAINRLLNLYSIKIKIISVAFGSKCASKDFKFKLNWKRNDLKTKNH